MKSKHRHELKTNELAEWLINLPQWAKKNLTTIIYVSALTVVVAGIYIWKNYEKNVVSVQKRINFTNALTQLSQRKLRIIQDQARGFDSSYTLLSLADNLQATAQNTKSDVVAALALIKQAEILRTELHYRLDAVSKQNLTSQINRAKASYAEALSRLTAPMVAGTINPSLTAKAKFGLGLCEEEFGNFAEAEQMYRDIAENALFEGTTAAAAAKLRLNTMADYQRKVVFKASPKPAPAKPELIRPQIQLNPADANLMPQMPNNVGNLLPNE